MPVDRWFFFIKPAASRLKPAGLTQFDRVGVSFTGTAATAVPVDPVKPAASRSARPGLTGGSQLNRQRLGRRDRGLPVQPAASRLYPTACRLELGRSQLERLLVELLYWALLLRPGAATGGC